MRLTPSRFFGRRRGYRTRGGDAGPVAGGHLPDAGGRDRGRDARLRRHGIRRSDPRAVRRTGTRRAHQRARSPALAHRRQTRRRSAGADRGHPGHERQPGLHRRSSGGRRLLRARVVSPAKRSRASPRSRRWPRRTRPRCLPLGGGPHRFRRARDVTRNTLVDVVARALPPAEPFARRPGDVRAAGLPAVAAGRLGALLRPIATPLVLSGFTPEIHDLWNAAFGAGGLVPTVGGQRGGPSSGVDDGPPPATGRPDRRQPDPGRPGHGGNRHGHPGRGRPGVCLRPPVLQPRTGPVADDPSPRHHAVAESRHLVAAGHHRPRARDESTRTDRPASTGVSGADPS